MQPLSQVGKLSFKVSIFSDWPFKFGLFPSPWISTRIPVLSNADIVGVEEDTDLTQPELTKPELRCVAVM